jgi:pyruvate dehydrogenase E1 component beta subunit
MGIKETLPNNGNHSTGSEPATHVVTLVEAVNLALARAMEQDENVVVLGEDVGTNGGVFRATAGLKERFGCKRVMDTPLAEALIAGISVGMAAQGLKPVAEIQFMGFAYATFEHIISHAARLRNRTRGRLHCPMVLRTPYGGGIHAPEHHCESTEALFAHIPGLRVVVPSSPTRAYGLLLAAIEDPDPVIFLEPSRIYRMVKQEIRDDGIALPLDTCFTLKAGTDITLISWGACVHETLQAARELDKQGISAEVIDVATLNPIDYATILASVEKTGRCVIIQEAVSHCSVGSEIAAMLAEKGLFFLKAPVGRVNGLDIPMPYFQRENLYMPDVHEIIATAIKTMEYA